MANLIKLFADRVEFPHQQLQYPLKPPVAKLKEGLEAYRELKLDFQIQYLSSQERQEISRFLQQYGQLLHNTLFPLNSFEQLSSGPLLLELGLEWSTYPWELLNDGTRWLHLHQGVIRFLFQPYQVEPPPSESPQPVRILGVSARPLPKNPKSVPARQLEELSDRFITPLNELLDQGARAREDFHYHILDHANMGELEAALARKPDVLFFSGLADETGWFLEHEDFSPQTAGWEWLLARIRKAVGDGLNLIVLNDSPGLGSPLTAASHARELLRAGAGNVVRFDGRLARPRQQDYLRTLLRHMRQGASVSEAHLASVRRLQRRFEEAWDWSFMRLYGKALPRQEKTVEEPVLYRDFSNSGTGLAAVSQTPSQRVSQTVSQTANAASVRPGPTAGLEIATELPPFHTPQPPPALGSRKRLVGREAELSALAAALKPEAAEKSPLVFLSGAAGSGKTLLAKSLARRLRRRFASVVYLHGRDLPPNPFDIVEVQGIERNGRPVEWPLVSALARHLQAPQLASGKGDAWKSAMRTHFENGRSHLIILDRLESFPGYESFCAGLCGLPNTNRVLVLSRNYPPLLPGAYFELTPVTEDALAGVYGEELRRKLTDFGDDGQLLRYCCQDLFAPQLLRRLHQWPDAEEIALALEDWDNASGEERQKPSSELVTLLLDKILELVRDDGVLVLRLLAIFPYLVHREMLVQGTGLNDKRLHGALAALQWHGLVEAHDNDHYFTIPPRLHAQVATALLNQGFISQVKVRLLRAYQLYLSGLRPVLESLEKQDDHAPPIAYWAENAVIGKSSAQMRTWQRLGIERLNLAELAAMVTDESDWSALSQLAEEAAALVNLPGMEDAWALVNHCLSAAGQARNDRVLFAQALNQLAEPLLNNGEPERARLLLEQALELLESSKGWPVLAKTYRLLAKANEDTDRLVPSQNLLHSAVELAQQMVSPKELVRACASLLRIWKKTDEMGQGEAFLRPRIEFLQQNNHPLQALALERMLGDVMAETGRESEADTQYRTVLDQCRLRNAHAESARTLLGLAGLQAKRREPEQALALWQNVAKDHPSLEIAEQRKLLEEVGRQFELDNQPERALDTWLSLRALVERAARPGELIPILDHIGGLYYQLGEQEKSTRCYEERLMLQEGLPLG